MLPAPYFRLSPVSIILFGTWVSVNQSSLFSFQTNKQTNDNKTNQLVWKIPSNTISDSNVIFSGRELDQRPPVVRSGACQGHANLHSRLDSVEKVLLSVSTLSPFQLPNRLLWSDVDSGSLPRPQTQILVQPKRPHLVWCSCFIPDRLWLFQDKCIIHPCLRPCVSAESGGHCGGSGGWTGLSSGSHQRSKAAPPTGQTRRWNCGRYSGRSKAGGLFLRGGGPHECLNHFQSCLWNILVEKSVLYTKCIQNSSFYCNVPQRFDLFCGIFQHSKIKSWLKKKKAGQWFKFNQDQVLISHNKHLLVRFKFLCCIFIGIERQIRKWGSLHVMWHQSVELFFPLCLTVLNCMFSFISAVDQLKHKHKLCMY